MTNKINIYVNNKDAYCCITEVIDIKEETAF